MAAKDETTIKLDNENYEEWCIYIKSKLLGIFAWEVASGKIPRPTPEIDVDPVEKSEYDSAVIKYRTEAAAYYTTLAVDIAAGNTVSSPAPTPPIPPTPSGTPKNKEDLDSWDKKDS